MSATNAEPYSVQLTLTGTASLLFHRWQCDAVAAKAAATKGSTAKKTDDIESYIWRLENGNVALPGSYVASALVAAAKFRQDPRSPRKSAVDLFKAGVVSTTELADLSKPTWDFIDRRRALVQRAAITRERPAMRPGWQATVQFTVLLPEYIGIELLRDVAEAAGRFVGVGDFRPAFGRFSVTSFEEVTS